MVVPPLKIDIDQGYKRSDAKDAQMGWSPCVGRHWKLLHVFMYKNIFWLCKQNKVNNLILLKRQNKLIVCFLKFKCK